MLHEVFSFIFYIYKIYSISIFFEYNLLLDWLTYDMQCSPRDWTTSYLALLLL